MNDLFLEFASTSEKTKKFNHWGRTVGYFPKYLNSVINLIAIKLSHFRPCRTQKKTFSQLMFKGPRPYLYWIKTPNHYFPKNRWYLYRVGLTLLTTSNHTHTHHFLSDSMDSCATIFVCNCVIYKVSLGNVSHINESSVPL